MTNQSPRPLLSPEKLRDMLDVMVDLSCENFYEAWQERSPLPFDPETDELIPEESDAADEKLLQLVFHADARAQVENDEFNIVSNIAWVNVAREAIIRMGRKYDMASDLHRLRIFVGSDIAMQADAYKDMADRRETERGSSVHHNCTGHEYATLVAIGAVILGEKSEQIT